MKKERMQVQKNLCYELEKRDSFDFRNSQVFLELFASEVDADEKTVTVESNGYFFSLICGRIYI